ncbi:maleylpyruvate isomerase family mycothiol-dependent enzyme [Nakamurella sp. YIM 132087]|uniref:Maleylpyruvate isomerase family mycothiol-dependent enzyme n=1 Tax=Nakamurella alba TaxID=2665158 RepID=A0A7K1FSM1_9ACTN|nr:maleylpyruvate isomerase family mycothiol-dependent enzyme [Nakamurella alba]
MIHQERARLAADLTGLADDRWTTRSLCGDWTVEQTLAHLTSGASIGTLRWIGSIVGARFDADLHNARRLAEHRGTAPELTLRRYRSIVTSTTVASGHMPAWLGEIVVHGQDIRHPLGIRTVPSVDASAAVAEFFVSRNFTVNSKKAVTGLSLTATDGPFHHGTGPEVVGPTIALVMAMAGRHAYLDELSGPGLPVLRERTTTF